MRKIFGFKSLLILIILLFVTMSISVSAAAPVATGFNINVRTNLSYTFFNEYEFANNIVGSFDSIIISRLPTRGKLFYNGIQLTNTTTNVIPITSIRTLKYTRNASQGTTADYFNWYARNSGQNSNTVSTTITVSNTANNAPVTSDYTIYTYKNGTRQNTIIATDADDDGLTYVSSNPSHGTATMTGSSVTYVNNGDSSDTDSFTVTVSDGLGGTTVSTVTVYITSISVPTSTYNVSMFTTDNPLLCTGAIDATTTHGTIYLGSDTDPSNGTVEYLDNTWTYTPNSATAGTDQFKIGISDDAGNYEIVTVNITIIEPYNVTFNSQGGSLVDPITAYNTSITAPDSPTKTGFSFGGWYKEAGCTNVWDFNNDVVTADKTLYAKWVANLFTITTNITGSGTVTPLNPIINYGETQTFTITPSSGYKIASITFDSSPVVVTNGTYTTPEIVDNAVLNVIFEVKVLTPPSIVTGIPQNKTNINLNVRNKNNQIENKSFAKSSLSYATILNPDAYQLISYGMLLRDTYGKWVDLPVEANAHSGQFAVHIFGDGVEGDIGFISGQEYTLQAYLRYSDNGITKIVYGLVEPFVWQQ